MPVTDTIADFITRIRNAASARHKVVDAPHSKLKEAIAVILKEQGYVQDFEVISTDGPGKLIRVKLKYYQNQPTIKEITRISRPGRRVYSSVEKLPRVYNGLGIAIVSTPSGVVTDKRAREMNVGGEVLCTVW